jgi:hypothetical protein
VSETKRSFREQIFRVLRSPSIGFPQIEEDDLRKGILLICIIGLLSSMAGVIYLSKTEFDLSRLVQGGHSGLGGGFFSGGSQSTPEIDPDVLRRTMTPFLAIGGIVGAFTRWLIPSVLVLITAKVLIGDGITKRMLAMTAFASLPLLVQQFLRVVDAYTISTVDLTALKTAIFPSTSLILRAMNQGIKVFNVFGLLTLALTVYAVSANYGSPKRRAITVSVVAYLAYVLLKVFLPI